MNMTEYQQLAQRTANPDQERTRRLLIACLGLSGEAGEVADYVKKVIGHGHPEDRDKLYKELGDCLWYIAEIASIYGWNLNGIAEANIAKLKKRYPEGFSEERSINRQE